ncbi:hypothetical protein ACFQ2B_19275 [Streptomyces stramineus]
MSRIVDLTSPIDPRDLDFVPESMPDLALVIAPKIDYHTHDAWGLDFMVTSFGCDPDDLPRREGPAGRSCARSAPTAGRTSTRRCTAGASARAVRRGP